MKDRVQFCHVRRYSHTEWTGKEHKHMPAGKGGMTVSLEVPDIEGFKLLKPSLETGLLLTLGVAKCSDKDNYNKKLGREICKGRMKPSELFVTSKSDTEVQLLSKEHGLTLILRKHAESNRVYFEDVVIL